MNIDQIKQSLCYHDERNPNSYINDGIDINPIKNGPCFCDNCFYRRDELAKELLRLKELTEKE